MSFPLTLSVSLVVPHHHHNNQLLFSVERRLPLVYTGQKLSIDTLFVTPSLGTVVTMHLQLFRNRCNLLDFDFAYIIYSFYLLFELTISC